MFSGIGLAPDLGPVLGVLGSWLGDIRNIDINIFLISLIPKPSLKQFALK